MNPVSNDANIQDVRRSSNVIHELSVPQVAPLDDQTYLGFTCQEKVRYRKRPKASGRFRWLAQCAYLMTVCSRHRPQSNEYRHVLDTDNAFKVNLTADNETSHLEMNASQNPAADCYTGCTPFAPVGLEKDLAASSKLQNSTGKETKATSNDNLITKLFTTKAESLPNSQMELSLLQVIKECEQRIEFLYNRLIWLGNVNCITGFHPKHRLGNHVVGHRMQSSQLNESQKLQHDHSGMSNKPEGPVSCSEHCELSETTEKQLARLSEKMRSLKSQVDTISFLSWLGIVEEPTGSKIANPGHSSPLPNPQQHLIRRSDGDTRCTIQEFKRLCQQSLTEKLRLDLRRSTFNNWPWSDAWLIRFVEQMYHDLDFIPFFDLPLARLRLWLCDVYRRYNRVPFHNYKHAFMVAQMCYSIIWTASLNTILDKEEQLALLTSAICHDLDHPGFNNTYQINAGTILAMRYNDQSPLENHHTAMAFDILSHSEANPFVNIPPAKWRRIRDVIIKCILATDMSRHNEILNQFNNIVIADIQCTLSIEQDSGAPSWVVDKAQRDLVLMIILKTCDISNEARPLHVAAPWINRLLAEFFHQSDYEKVSGLPVAPFMDREKVTKSASQCGFIRFVILPLFEALAKLLPAIKPTIVDPARDQLEFYSKLQIEEEARAKTLLTNTIESVEITSSASDNDVEERTAGQKGGSVDPHTYTINVAHDKHSEL